MTACCAGRAKELLECNLLQPGDTVYITCTIKGQNDAIELTARSLLLIDPERADAAGLALPPKERELFYQTKVKLKQVGKEGTRRQSIGSTALTPPRIQQQQQAPKQQGDQQWHQTQQEPSQQEQVGESLQAQAPWRCPQQQQPQEGKPQRQAAVAAQVVLQQPNAVVGDLRVDAEQQPEEQVRWRCTQKHMLSLWCR